MKTKSQRILSYLIIIASILGGAGLGRLFVNLGMDWFENLRKPTEFVPSFVIPIVWTVVYIIFVVVLCLWVTNDDFSIKTFVLLIVNAVLNVLWCLLFFTLNSTLLGIISIVLLLISAWLLVNEIYKYKKLYGYLTLIYPVWASIATCLNLALWILN